MAECPEPALRPGVPGDAKSDSAGRGQMFEDIVIPGFTDVPDATAGLAIADFDHDGLNDVFSINRKKAVVQGGRPTYQLRLFLNDGCWRWKQHTLQITGSNWMADKFAPGAQVPNLADFNGDGFLDIVITNSGRQSAGTIFLLSKGAFDTFEDRSQDFDIRNLGSYSRQSSFGDVNGDGWLDVAIGADNIGNAAYGYPTQRLYLYQPGGESFESGTFKDISGTSLIPEFGGDFKGDPRYDKAGPQLTLVDLDNDGDLDMVQGYHSDMLMGKWDDPNSSGMYDQGIYVWRNLLKETGTFGYERIIDNGLADYARMRYNAWLGEYEPVVHGLGLPYINFADVNNDGLLDAIATGASDPTWHVHSDQVVGAFWKNLGGFRFKKVTSEVGLDALNWNYGEWEKFWSAKLDPRSQYLTENTSRWRMKTGFQNWTTQQLQFYGGDIVFGDYDNDGWQDFLFVDRHELSGSWGTMRNVLFMNNGDGTFRPVKTEISGIDNNTTSAEAADLNNDGLLDLVYVDTPENASGAAAAKEIPKDKLAPHVYWNTGAHGGRENHWIRIRFSGISDHKLIGAQAITYEAGTLEGDQPKLVGMRRISSNHSYRSGGALDAHFGLGNRPKIDFKIVLLSGQMKQFSHVESDRIVEIDWEASTVKEVKRPTNQ
ncbi:MAG: CRTAC1 family protein [Pirellulaceae bacterium]|nr:CRTAC1 family protein [Pirellulaceae bacterium]